MLAPVQDDIPHLRTDEAHHDGDLAPDTHIQAIANTAGFHFGFIKQGGSSLYPTLAQGVTNLKVLRILLPIGPTETSHFQIRTMGFSSANHGSSWRSYVRWQHRQMRRGADNTTTRDSAVGVRTNEVAGAGYCLCTESSDAKRVRAVRVAKIRSSW